MTSLIYFTTSLPSPIAEELLRAGYRVLEAFAVSEVMHLFEHEEATLCIIDASIETARANVIAEHFPTLRLEPEATAREVVSELWLLEQDEGMVPRGVQ